MAKPKNIQEFDYEDTDYTPESAPASSAPHFIVQDDKPQRVATREISEEEKERRELKARFKKLRGYKPPVKDLDELHRLVVEAEQAAGIFRD
jgi:hypothetical protein